MFGVATVVFGTGICCLVLENLDEAVEKHRKYRAESWSSPVDPVVAVKSPQHNIWTEGPGWIERATRVKNTCREVD